MRRCCWRQKGGPLNAWEDNEGPAVPVRHTGDIGVHHNPNGIMRSCMRSGGCRMMARLCLSCKWYSRESRSCDYYLLNFIRRGCPADDNCKRYKPGRRQMGALPNSFKPLNGRSKKIRERDAQCKALYERGMSDSQIAAELGCAHETIRRWRLSYGLPTQKEVRKRNDTVQADGRGNKG